MRILHTSDWHIGRTLYDKRRHREHAAFLEWLHQTIVERKVDVLLVCGDIFDTIAPSNRSLELYYSFLRHIVDSGCRHVVITGGNHDSPSLLDAPKEVLESIGVHVVGGAAKEVGDEVIVLTSRTGEPELVVCAVPYLRDRDVREVSLQESMEDKSNRLIAGIASHYQAVANAAHELRSRMEAPVPMVVTGHLFAVGGKTAEGDGVRDLYVGTIARIGADVFPANADYVALGHLHVPQRVGASDTIRYCGSPIPMGFGEARYEKEVVLVDVSNDSLFPMVQTLPVPCFQQLRRISGTIGDIEAALNGLVALQESVWVEVEYSGTLSASALRQQLDALVENTSVEILRLRNTKLMDQVLHQSGWQQTLDDLDEHEVFRRRLAMTDVQETEHEDLAKLYDQVLFSLHEEDSV
ncbi:MAG: exonuclease SbcCD subunit D C-terminal domain-containing protein [Sphaerochaetaceae bacterium]